MCSMYDTLWAYWRRITVETEILDLLLGMLFTALPCRPYERVARNRISRSDLGLFSLP